MIKTIFLDLDGPLLDGKHRHYQCYSDILNMYGYSPMPIEMYWNMKRSRKSRIGQLAVSGAESIYDDFLEKWLECIEMPEYLALDRVQPGVICKLKEWNNNGIKVVLVTMRSKKEALLDQLKLLGLAPYFFSVIVCQHSKGGIGKAEEVLRSMPDVDTSASLWIGDTEAELEGARRLGCPVFLLTCGLRTKSYLASLSPEFLGESLVEADGRISNVS